MDETPTGKAVQSDALLEQCRAAFAAMIKDENFYRELKCCRDSLRQHWSGPRAGFKDGNVQKRYLDFQKGWFACSNAAGQTPAAHKETV